MNVFNFLKTTCHWPILCKFGLMHLWGKGNINCKFYDFCRVFQRKNRHIEMVKMVGERLPNWYPYCTDDSSCRFQDSKLLFCRSIVHLWEMCKLLRFWFFLFIKKTKKQLLNFCPLYFFGIILDIGNPYCMDNFSYNF